MKRKIIAGILVIMMLITTYALTGCGEKDSDDKDDENNNNSSVNSNTNNDINSVLNSSKTEAETQAIEMFNSKFTSYAGVQSAASVRSLCRAITVSNSTNAERQINPVGCFEDTLQLIQSRISNQNRYLVGFGYDASGYINTVTITVEQ